MRYRLTKPIGPFKPGKIFIDDGKQMVTIKEDFAIAKSIIHRHIKIKKLYDEQATKTQNPSSR